MKVKTALVWIFLLLATTGTFVLTKQLGREWGDTASVFLSGGKTHEIQIYSDRAVPVSITANPGDEIIFKIMDNGFHNIAEERSPKRGVRLESGELSEGDSYILSFSKSGMYSFYDRMNVDINLIINIK